MNGRELQNIEDANDGYDGSPMSKEPLPEQRVDCCDKKYTVIHSCGMNLRALRYGEAWRDLVGDGLVLALAMDLAEAREQRDSLLKQVIELRSSLVSIAGDFHPASQAEAFLALDEMRDAVTALAAR